MVWSVQDSLFIQSELWSVFYNHGHGAVLKTLSVLSLEIDEFTSVVICEELGLGSFPNINGIISKLVETFL